MELTPDQIASIRIEFPKDMEEQKAASLEWRAIEDRYRNAMSAAESEFSSSKAKFLKFGAEIPVNEQYSLDPEV